MAATKDLAILVRFVMFSPDALIEEMLYNSKQLFAHRKPNEKGLPKSGVKDNSPDGSWLHQQRLQLYWAERRALLAEQRVEKLGNVVKGQWNPEKDLVELEKELGKFWAYMGFVDHKRKWLHPEEALFLMETSVLEVWYGGVPVSIQQAYSSFLGGFLSFEEYQVYAHLRRLGFVVIRHRGPCESTRYERQIRLDQHILKRNRKRKLDREYCDNSKVGRSCDVSKDTADESRIDSTGTETLDTQRGAKESLRPKTNKASDKTAGQGAPPDTGIGVERKDWVSVCEGRLSASTEDVEKNSQTDHTRQSPRLVDFSKVDVPSVSGKGRITLEAPSAELLPPNIIYPSDRYEVDLSRTPINVAKEKKTKPEQDGVSSDGLDFSFPDFFGSAAYRCIKARNWQDYKSQKRRMDEKLNSVEKSPASHLWTGEVTPLVRPEDGISTACVLGRLRVIQEMDRRTATSCAAVESSIRVLYDVYQPDYKFRKSTPGTPHYRVCVQKQSDPPPSLAHITEVTAHLDDDVPLLTAVVDSGDIALYIFTPVSLPIDVSMG